MDNTCTPSSTCFFGTRTTWLHSARLVGAAVRNRFLIAPLIVVLIATFSGGLGRQYWLLLRECLIHMSSTIWISIGQQSHGSEGSSGIKPSRTHLARLEAWPSLRLSQNYWTGVRHQQRGLECLRGKAARVSRVSCFP
jgi:hypothetical protein